MTARRILIAGGTGFIGSALTKHLHTDDVTLLTRRKDSVKNPEQAAITWAELTTEQLARFDIVINLAGANIGDKRWSNKQKQNILQSRVKTTEKLATLLAKLGNKAPRLFSASAIGIYGNQHNHTVDEATPIERDQFTDFVNEVGAKWEQATTIATQAGVIVIHMRFGIVLAPFGGMLKKLLLSFKLGLGQILGNGNQMISWVALDDLVRAIEFLLNHDLVDPVNIVSPNPISQKTFATELAKALHRPLILRLPAQAIKWLFGQMGIELLLSGISVLPKKLLDAGFSFNEAHFSDFLKQNFD